MRRMSASVLDRGNKWGKLGRAKTTNGCWGKVCPCSFLLFYFHFSDNFLPISYQYIQETDEEDKRGGGGDG